MPKITFKTQSGELVEVEQDGGTLMEAAVDSGIEGIDADCGGVCSCGTCHVKVAREWMERVGPPNEIEQDLLDRLDGTDGQSRLSCQIELTDDLDGLLVQAVRL